MKLCHKCKTPWEEKFEPPAREACAKCGLDLHVCLNCRFYDPSKSNSCIIDGLEPVTDKSKFNYCDEFKFKEDSAAPANISEAQRAKDHFNKIFKK